jgi:AbrB family looped-hinge helix DNA binding protein
MVYTPFMTAVVPIDRAGRIVIPKETREAQGIAPGTKFLLIEGKDGSLWLQRLDPQELARRIHEELRGIDLAPLVAKIDAEMESTAESKYPSAARR